eukprot:877431-Rhodomonas_salina.3
MPVPSPAPPTTLFPPARNLHPLPPLPTSPSPVASSDDLQPACGPPPPPSAAPPPSSAPPLPPCTRAALPRTPLAPSFLAGACRPARSPAPS